jgi:hypothetical protein
MKHNDTGKGMENQDKNSDEHECHPHFCVCALENYEELHPKQEVNPPEGHKCMPFCDQLNNKHIGIHRAMSLEGEKWETEEKN